MNSAAASFKSTLPMYVACGGGQFLQTAHQRGPCTRHLPTTMELTSKIKLADLAAPAATDLARQLQHSWTCLNPADRYAPCMHSDMC